MGHSIERMSQPQKETDWVLHEFGGADLGDERRELRLLSIAMSLAADPSASLPQAMESQAALKAAYRFFDNDAIEEEALLAPHVWSTLERIKQVPLILCPQDTTELDYSSHKEKKNVGQIGNERGRGLWVHTTLTTTPEGLPLGLLAQQVWARPRRQGRKPDHKYIPIEKKESFKWLASLEQVQEAKECCPETTFVSVGDREADIYELFIMERVPGVEVLVRAAWNRKVEHEEKYLWPALEKQPVSGELLLNVPRQRNRPAREARVSVRYGEITLVAPKRLKKEYPREVHVWAVLVREEHPPKESTPLEWLLLTSQEVRSFEEAAEKSEWYSKRYFHTEVFHKVLKSGCTIEKLQLGDGDRIRRVLPIYSVIAWRILFATMLARKVPEIPTTALLQNDEWQALFCSIHRVPTPPEEPPSLSQAVRWIGQLGGFIGRKSDGEPGVIVLWRGFQRLTDLTHMYKIMRPSPQAPKTKQNISQGNGKKKNSG